ncbi:nitroreductase [Gracilibacillus halotolerans]|uniref:Putative NAD(P)H nitroreductase n=1 Tax=Gracilibacillus halotolerans TaxID=74386 RepID=A0A841RTQ8_9BACI|nr:nitroreductase [Gracilibacillus halotolerans]MBB6514324.1 nitroreductase [Gracilibacillus halotolerans]
MDLTSIMKNRRSVSVYSDKPVSPSLIEEFLETAVYVPNHKLTEPWRFVFITDESKEKLAEINRKIAVEKNKVTDPEQAKVVSDTGYEKIKSIPFIMFVINKLHEDEKLREEDYAATSCVIQNLSLLAEEEGMSVFWKTGKLSDCEETRQLIGLKDDERIVGMLYIGYPSKVVKGVPRESAKNRIKYI